MAGIEDCLTQLCASAALGTPHGIRPYKTTWPMYYVLCQMCTEASSWTIMLGHRRHTPSSVTTYKQFPMIWRRLGLRPGLTNLQPGRPCQSLPSVAELCRGKRCSRLFATTIVSVPPVKQKYVGYGDPAEAIMRTTEPTLSRTYATRPQPRTITPTGLSLSSSVSTGP